MRKYNKTTVQNDNLAFATYSFSLTLKPVIEEILSPIEGGTRI